MATPSNRAINIRLPVRENKYHVFVRSFGLDVVRRHLFFPVPKYELLPSRRQTKSSGLRSIKHDRPRTPSDRLREKVGHGIEPSRSGRLLFKTF